MQDENNLFMVGYNQYFEHIQDYLVKERSFNPCYIIAKEKAKTRIQTKYPKIIVHDHFQAWRGNFPSEIKSIKLTPIDSEVISHIASDFIQSMDMLQRMDNFGYFSFQERLRYNYKCMNYWYGILVYYKPKLIVFESIPHIPHEYMIYVLSKFLKIQTVMFFQTLIDNRVVPYASYEKGSTQLVRVYKDILKKDMADIQHSAFLKKFFSEQTKMTNSNEPIYYTLCRNHVKTIKRRELYYAKRAANLIMKTVLRPTIGIERFVRLFKVIDQDYVYKRNEESLQVYRRNLLQNMVDNYRALKVKRKLYRYYEKISTEIIPDQQFIYCPLHYQPEMTSSPMGGLYNNQFLMLQLLSQAVPKDMVILVKEHFAQFSPTWFGEGSRTKSYYNDILNFTNIKLMSIDVSSERLVKQAKAVATLTGTTGIEALFQCKPVLAFGYPWYLQCEGVYTIRSTQDLINSLRLIDCASLSLDNVKRFFIAMEKISFKGFLGGAGQGPNCDNWGISDEENARRHFF